MRYLISYRDGGVDYDYKSYDELEDARQAYERAIEDLQDAESVKLADSTGDTIDCHFFWVGETGAIESIPLWGSTVKSRAFKLCFECIIQHGMYIQLLNLIITGH